MICNLGMAPARAACSWTEPGQRAASDLSKWLITHTFITFYNPYNPYTVYIRYNGTIWFLTFSNHLLTGMQIQTGEPSNQPGHNFVEDIIYKYVGRFMVVPGSAGNRAAPPDALKMFEAHQHRQKDGAGRQTPVVFDISSCRNGFKHVKASKTWPFLGTLRVVFLLNDPKAWPHFVQLKSPAVDVKACTSWRGRGGTDCTRPGTMGMARQNLRINVAFPWSWWSNMSSKSGIVNIQMLMGDQNWRPSSRHKSVQVELLAVKSLFLLLEPGIVIRKSMHI